MEIAHNHNATLKALYLW